MILPTTLYAVIDSSDDLEAHSYSELGVKEQQERKQQESQSLLQDFNN